MGKESVIESAVSTYAKNKGFYVRKFKSPGNRGVPDRIFLSPSGVWFTIEFKAPGGKTTALQEREMILIERNNGLCYVVDNVKYGKEIIEFFE